MVVVYGASEILQDMVGGWMVVGPTCNGHGLLTECMLISLVLDGERTEVTIAVYVQLTGVLRSSTNKSTKINSSELRNFGELQELICQISETLVPQSSLYNI